MSIKSVDERIADALLIVGSSDHTVRFGPILALMSDLAREGELQGVSRAFIAYAALIPTDRQKVADAVPAKILNHYVYLCRQRPTTTVMPWLKRNRNWAKRLVDALPSPYRFEQVARSMADETGTETIDRASAGTRATSDWARLREGGDPQVPAI